MGMTGQTQRGADAQIDKPVFWTNTRATCAFFGIHDFVQMCKVICMREDIEVIFVCSDVWVACHQLRKDNLFGNLSWSGATCNKT